MYVCMLCGFCERQQLIAVQIVDTGITSDLLTFASL